MGQHLEGEVVRKPVFDVLGAKMTEKCLKIAILGPSMPFGLGKFGHFRPENAVFRAVLGDFETEVNIGPLARVSGLRGE